MYNLFWNIEVSDFIWLKLVIRKIWFSWGSFLMVFSVLKFIWFTLMVKIRMFVFRVFVVILVIEFCGFLFVTIIMIRGIFFFRGRVFFVFENAMFRVYWMVSFVMVFVDRCFIFLIVRFILDFFLKVLSENSFLTVLLYWSRFIRVIFGLMFKNCKMFIMNFLIFV